MSYLNHVGLIISRCINNFLQIYMYFSYSLCLSEVEENISKKNNLRTKINKNKSRE